MECDWQSASVVNETLTSCEICTLTKLSLCHIKLMVELSLSELQLSASDVIDNLIL